MTRTIHNLSAYATLGCFMLLVLVGFSTGLAHATDVSGPISSDTTWTLAGSLYVVTGNTLVRVDVRLTIVPGVTVKFDLCTLAIGGTLIARGTPTQIITFTSNRPNPQACDWEEIKFRDSSADAVFDGEGNYLSGCIMEYCKVEYAGANQYAIHLDHASPFLHYVTVANNNAWSYSVAAGIFIWFSSPTIAHCTVSNSGIYGILSEDSSSSPTITHCTVSNSGHGIAPHSGSSPTITHCSIFNNRYNGIYVNRCRWPVPTIAHCIVFNNGGTVSTVTTRPPPRSPIAPFPTIEDMESMPTIEPPLSSPLVLSSITATRESASLPTPPPCSPPATSSATRTTTCS